MKALKIKSHLRDYTVCYEGSFHFLGKLSQQIMRPVLIVDRNVFCLYQKYFSAFRPENIYYFDANEDNKTLEAAQKIYDFVMTRSAKRNTTIVSVGGGITQDVTGFVASTLYRGVPWIYIPTTLLAQADSCIGGKTSLNYKNAKNLIGTFYPPFEVYIYPEFLKTLSRHDFYSGLGEIVKFQLMKKNAVKNIDKSAKILKSLRPDSKDIAGHINDSLMIKKSYMEDDEFDFGRRNLLNYGHCFGHALEAASGYDVPHGTGVLVGIIFANIIALKRGFLKSDTFNKINRELVLKNIPMELKKEHFHPDVLFGFMQNDKKRTGRDLAVIIPDKKFNLIKVTDVTEKEFGRALEFLNKTLVVVMH